MPPSRSLDIKVEPRQPEPPMRRSALREVGMFLLDVVKVAVVSLAIIWPVRTFLIQPFYVRGESMLPNFQEREYLIIDEISYRFQDPARGDTVVLYPPGRHDEYYIKRIVGLPGEAVELRDGHVIVYNELHPDGVKLDESAYLPPLTATRSLSPALPEGAPLRLRPGEYFVLGDNRRNSQDSRAFGPLPEANIVGRVWIRGWPFNRVGSISSPAYDL